MVGMWITFVVIVLVVVLFLFLFRRRQRVPKIIHQIAPADTSKWPAIWFKCQRSWRDNFPDYEYRMWTDDDDIDELVRTKYPRYYEMFKGYDKNIKRIDAARYFILNEYGGIYADMYYECHKRFEFGPGVSMNQTPVLGQGVLQNALMASPPKHPLWQRVFDALVENKDKEEVCEATGPLLVDKFLKDVTVLPKDKFSTREAEYATHYCTATWLRPREEKEKHKNDGDDETDDKGRAILLGTPSAPS